MFGKTVVFHRLPVYYSDFRSAYRKMFNLYCPKFLIPEISRKKTNVLPVVLGIFKIISLTILMTLGTDDEYRKYLNVDKHQNIGLQPTRTGI